jgi:hypothetical protein
MTGHAIVQESKTNEKSVKGALDPNISQKSLFAHQGRRKK